MLVRAPHIPLTFLNAQAQIIDDPRSSTIQPSIVTAYNNAMQITACEAQGRRPSQEDTFFIGDAKPIKYLTDKQICDILNKSIYQVNQALLEKFGPEFCTGATLTSVIVKGNKVFTANVGDGTATVMIRDQNKNIIHVDQQNKILHHITAENVASLKALGLRINAATLRLTDKNGEDHLNIYRAMGDFHLQDAGLTANPDIYLHEITIPDDGDAYVVVACDGLTEQISSAALARKLNRIERDDTILANTLVGCGLASGSGDNITALTAFLHEDATHHLAVFDGHGGKRAAIFLQEHFGNLVYQSLLLQAARNFQDKLQIEFPDLEILRYEFNLYLSTLSLKELEPFKVVIAKLIYDTHEKTQPQACYALIKKLYQTLNPHLKMLYELTQLARLDQARRHKDLPALNLNFAIRNTLFFILSFNCDTLSFDASENKSQRVIESELAVLQKMLDNLLLTLVQLTKDRPYFNKITSSLNRLLQQSYRLFNFSDYHQRLSKFKSILLKTYALSYAFEAKKSFFHRSRAPQSDLAHWLEKVISEYIPEVNEVQLPSKIGTNFCSRALWYLGLTDPKLVDRMQQMITQKNFVLSAFKTNPAKLLNQLGPRGHAASMRFFNLKTQNLPEAVVMKTYLKI